ncbi:DUF2156 domain-containing protein [Nanchangia anserum]|nr:DUF2156 domain-containing protein [Nanchangia anserum]
MDTARDQGIEGISLNFAMFRQVFVSGAAVDAGWRKKLVFFAFRQASKVWQLESLYESNARYQPDWYSRYLCYPSDPTVSMVLAASGMLEGFLPARPSSCRVSNPIGRPTRTISLSCDRTGSRVSAKRPRWSCASRNACVGTRPCAWSSLGTTRSLRDTTWASLRRVITKSSRGTTSDRHGDGSRERVP